MKRSRVLTVAAFTVAVVGVTLFVACRANAGGFGSPGESPIVKSDEGVKAWEIQKVFREIYDLYSDRVVFVSTEQTVKIPQNPFFEDPFFGQMFGNQGRGGERTQKRTGLGTGFLVSEDGYICTNFHVVNGVDKVTVKVNGKTYKAEVVGSDERSDIALLKISPSEKFKPA